MEHTCQCCGQPTTVKEQGSKPIKVDGKIVFTDVLYFTTCFNHDCTMYSYTLALAEHDRIAATGNPKAYR